MNYRMLEVGEILENTDEFEYSPGEWIGCKEGGNTVGRCAAHMYRRPIRDNHTDCIQDTTEDFEFRMNGVAIFVDRKCNKQQAAAFLGAIAMMLDGQADS